MRLKALRKTESFTLPVETERFREYCRSPSFLARADSEIWLKDGCTAKGMI